ncbi:rod-shaped morphology protein [Corynebacterium resistens DSM 45100]|uniref:Rod-shaped morphology protein n=2 Tax=Corynebacterium resistens TaxID=258224 RepID=F8E3F1_CORRG|nr:rod-shaped morphology protein [Corynebacterium resistens DSM 45100]
MIHMANPFSKGWKYLMQSMDSKIEENADPHVQIQQATEASKRQHQEITERAAAVIGNRNQLEMKLHRLQEDISKLQDNTRMALQQADKAAAEGNQAKAQELNNTAEVFASQLVSVEQQFEETKQMHAGAVEAAKQAEQQQKQSAARLEEQLAQINQLRSQADQAKMQEMTSRSMQEMQGIQADDSVPTLDGVREKIEQRYANALGSQELVEGSVQGRMEEIASAGHDMKATSRLDQIRAELAAGSGSAASENKQLNAGSSDQNQQSIEAHQEQQGASSTQPKQGEGAHSRSSDAGAQSQSAESTPSPNNPYLNNGNN